MSEFFRIDEFARTPDGEFTRRDLSRFMLFGFDVHPLIPPDCPPPPKNRFFRLDEFAVEADGVLSARDRTRYTSFGFDIEPTAPAGNIAVYLNAPGATVTILFDRDILKEIQLALVEDPVDSGVSYTSGLWSSQEVVDYLNQRQTEFLKLTGVVLTRARVMTTPGVQRHPLPADWIASQRVAFRGHDGRVRSLHRVDPFELDHLLHAWEISPAPRPRYYSDGNLPTHTVEVAPRASDGGVLEVLYVALGQALSTTGVPFAVPVEFVAPIKWGVLASMLGKVGRANDPRRAEYCETRYREGIEAARVALSGWS